MLLSEWFDGPSKWHQGPFARGPAGNASLIKGDDTVSLCLYAGTIRCEFTPKQLARLGSVIRTRFPERVDEPNLTPVSVTVCFNEWEGTTFEDVRSVIHEYEQLAGSP